MRLFRLAPLAIVLSLLILGAETAKKPPFNPWTKHRAAMEWWILWPKADDRGLKLKTLPACLRACITPQNSVINIRGERISVHNVNRRVFCDPRLNLVQRYFVDRIGRCSLESCRYEHSLWRLRGHYDVWLKGLCIPPGVRRPKNVWRLKPDVPLKPRPMLDPSADYPDVSTDAGADADNYVDREAYDDYGWDAYEDPDWEDYKKIDWGTYGDGWDVYEGLDWEDHEDFDREAKITDEAANTTATRTISPSEERMGTQSMPANIAK